MVSHPFNQEVEMQRCMYDSITRITFKWDPQIHILLNTQNIQYVAMIDQYKGVWCVLLLL